MIICLLLLDFSLVLISCLTMNLDLFFVFCFVFVFCFSFLGFLCLWMPDDTLWNTISGLWFEIEIQTKRKTGDSHPWSAPQGPLVSGRKQESPSDDGRYPSSQTQATEPSGWSIPSWPSALHKGTSPKSLTHSPLNRTWRKKPWILYQNMKTLTL